jgi:integrase
MASSYTVRRGDSYHFRLRVPAELIPFIGSRELHSSLGHTTRKAAVHRASFLAFQSHSFFRKVRRLMPAMTPDQIAQLVADWRKKMFTRDGEIRRLIELDEHESYDRDSYEAHCEAISSMADEVLEMLVPMPQGIEGTSTPSKREQQMALAVAKELIATNEPDSDHVPLMTTEAFDSLDPVSAKDVARQFLLAVSQVYGRKSAMGRDAFATVPQQAPYVPQGSEASTPTTLNTPIQELPPNGPTIVEAWEAYCARQAQTHKAWVNGPEDSARRAWDDFVAVVGKDTRVSELNVQTVRRYEKFANEQPQRRLKQYRGLSLSDLIQRVNDGGIPKEHRRAALTVGKDTSAIRSFLDQCINDYAIPLPTGFKFLVAGSTEPGARRRRYEAWTVEEIRTLTDPQNLANFVVKRRSNARGRVAEDTPYPDGRQWADFPWIVLLTLYTGARRDEVVGLRPEDIAEDHEHSRNYSDCPIPVIYFDETDERGLKTDSAKRCVPIHPDLIELGIFELAKRRRMEGESRLLCTASTMGKGGKWATDAFKKYTQSLGLHVPKTKVLHSFRHAFKTVATGVMDASTADAIIGHAPQDSTGGTYIHALQVPQHQRAASVAKMRFPVDVQGIKAMLCGLGHGER